MSRRTLKDLAKEPITVLSAMAGATLLTLTVMASDVPASGSASTDARQVGGPTAADLRTGPFPRLEGLVLPRPEAPAREAADCSHAEVRGATRSGRLFVPGPGA